MQNFFDFHIFSFFPRFSILSYTLTLPISQVETQQVMASRSRSHTDFFYTDLLYSCAHFTVKIDEKFSLNDGFYF